jgi:imidazolonepropionase-like amidohydrolase
MRCLSIGLLLLFAACAGDGRNVLAIRNVTVVPATGAASLPNATVLIREGRITAIGRVDEIDIPRGALILDGARQYVVPGLIEMHAHTSKTRGSALALYVAHGVTTVRDMGGDHPELVAWREEIRSGTRVGPRLLLAGPYLESIRNVERMRNTPPHEMIEPVERTRVPVGSPERAQHVVDSLSHVAGIDGYIKVRTIEDLETYNAINAAAERHGLDVVGHTFGLTPEQILAAGQRGIEHFLFPPLDDWSPGDRGAVFRSFAEADVGIVPTLVTFIASAFASDSTLRTALDDSLGRIIPARRYLSRYLVDDWREQFLEREPETIALFRQVFASHVRNVQEMREAGVRIMAGSDVAVIGVYPGVTLIEELELFVDSIGMSPGEALAAATREPAEFLGLADSVGTIETGKVADLLLVDADPLVDVGNLRRVRAVVRAGRLFDRAALDALLAEVDQAPDQAVNDWPRRAH